MRVWITVLLLGLACNAQGARELKWGWSSAGSLGQLSTTTGANSNSGLLSTVIPGSGNDGGMLQGGAQADSVSSQAGISDTTVAEPPMPPGMARPPAIPGTPAYARQQARERAAAAAEASLAPAPAEDLAEVASAPVYAVYVGAEESPAGAPTVSVGSGGSVRQGAGATATGVAQNEGRAGAVSNRAGVRTEGAGSLAPAPAPASRNAGGLPGLADPFPSGGLIWTTG